MLPMSERRLRWGALIPDRWSWPRLLVAPSSFLLVLSLIATLIGKLREIRHIPDLGFWPSRWLAASAADVVVFLGLAAAFALAERATKRMAFVTIPLALAVTVLAMINVVYLSISGEQLSAQVLTLGVERAGDVFGMAGASVHVGPLRVIGLLLLVLAPPGLAVYAHHRAGKPLGITTGGVERARAAGACVVVALVLILVPTPRALGRMYGNAVARTCWGLVAGQQGWDGGLGLFSGYAPHDLVDPSTVDQLRAGARPNIVMIVLESTRRDVTSLAGEASSARTPNLVALAARGLELTHGRAVVGHTTKSLWSMLCARLPLLQPVMYETFASIDVQCLPHILQAAGWQTSFVQSAYGDFEDRPRLVHALGYSAFVAGEQIGGPRLGYLATDDEALVGQLARTIDNARGQPFMTTLLTSATHHPYVLTATEAARVEESGAPHATDRERYDRQVEASDLMLGAAIDLLRQRGVLENTIIVVLGDHGEGFGDKGVRQHASNYFEEGLRVPWVIAGPGVPIKRLDGNTSLVDLTPTLIDLLGVQLSPAATAATHARSVLRIDPTDRVLPFGCFFDNICGGFVVNTTKVVFVPESGQVFSFDLARDPEEQDPVPVPDHLAATLVEVRRQIDLHRTRGWPRDRAALTQFPEWSCPTNVFCHLKVPGRD